MDEDGYGWNLMNGRNMIYARTRLCGRLCVLRPVGENDKQGPSKIEHYDELRSGQLEINLQSAAPTNYYRRNSIRTMRPQGIMRCHLRIRLEIKITS